MTRTLIEAAGKDSSKARDARTLLLAGLVAVVVLVVYLLLPWKEPSGDNYGYFLGAKSLAEEGDLNLDEYEDALPKYSVHRYNGHLYSSFPTMNSLVLYPFFKAAHLVGYAVKPTKIAGLAATLFVAVSCSLLFITLAPVLTPRWAALLALALAFASPIFSNCASDFWSHVSAVFFGCLSIYLALRPASVWVGMGLGLSCPLAVLCRPQSAVGIAMLVLLWLSSHRRKLWLPFGISGALVGVIGSAAGLITSGRITGSYMAQANPGCFGDPALWSFLFSRSRGMLIYFPIAALALYEIIRYVSGMPSYLLSCVKGAWRRLRSDDAPERQLAVADITQVTAIAVLASTLIHSSYIMWSGGGCYGSRFSSDSVPWVIVLAAALLARSKHRKLLGVSVVVLFLLGFAANLPGALGCAPSWCVDTGMQDDGLLERSQLYCAWRDMLGLRNEQILIQLSVWLCSEPDDEPAVEIRYWNPTGPKSARLAAGVFGRRSSSEEYHLCKIHRGDRVCIGRGARDRLRLPLAKAFESCEWPEIRIHFAFIRDGCDVIELVSNVASVSFTRAP